MKMEKIEIKYGKCENLPKEIIEKYNLDKNGYYEATYRNEAHEYGLKENLESAGFEVLSEQINLSRDNKFFEHKKGDKVYYIEDIENIIKLKQKERDLYFLVLLKKEGCNSIRLQYWRDLLSLENNSETGDKK